MQVVLEPTPMSDHIKAFSDDPQNTIFIIMENFHDFGKIQFRLSRPKMYPLGMYILGRLHLNCH